MIKNLFTVVLLISFANFNNISASSNDSLFDDTGFNSTETNFGDVSSDSFSDETNETNNFESDKNVNEAKTDPKALQNQINNSNKVIQNIMGQIDGYKEKVRSLEDKVSEYETDVNSKQNVINELNDKLNVAKKELEDCKNDCLSQSDKHDKLSNNYQELVRANKELAEQKANDIKILGDQIKGLTEDLNGLAAANLAASINFDAARKTKEVLESKEQQLSSELRDLRLRKTWFKPFLVSTTIASSLLLSYVYRYLVSPAKTQKKNNK